jgi:hypothetical protein
MDTVSFIWQMYTHIYVEQCVNSKILVAWETSLLKVMTASYT